MARLQPNAFGSNAPDINTFGKIIVSSKGLGSNALGSNTLSSTALGSSGIGR